MSRRQQVTSDRRAFLGSGAAMAAGFTAYALAPSARADPLRDDPWSLRPGNLTAPYERPSHFEDQVSRTLSNPKGEPRVQNARTPLHLLRGTITPAALHFVVSQAGSPDIDPARHRLVIHGLVKRPLAFTIDALARYPMVSRIAFLECGGNSAPLFSPQPVQASLQALHGMVSCSEWTGVALSTLLEETGFDARAKWLIAEGADAPTLTRSVPLSKALDDAMIALYQNGERLMPANGYPMRLFLPGWEGNMNIKWLRRIKLTDGPAMTFPESKTYAQILPDGKAYRFYFIQEVKSFITQPSPGLAMPGPGLYQISGIAYSGEGRITRVLVSTDGGKNWTQAALQEPVLPKSLTRFSVPWLWDGDPAVLQSRAIDERGNVQPTRAQFVAHRGELKSPVSETVFPNQHFNAVTSWGIDARGEVKHVYA
ncbi:MAG TPA: sulfite dehydrogenase [Usitatibacter sp.]|jgi:sulfane dehydrogenase subunit SoxC|nr:sulfite dehydrogenase [Usitatibacter sp.]